MSDSHEPQARGPERRALWRAFIVKLLVCLLQLGGVYLSGSLALQADSAHVAMDSLGNVVGLWAIARGVRAQSEAVQKRTEAWGGGTVGLLICVAALGIIWQACEQWGHKREVVSLPMLIIAAVGLGANALNMYNLGFHAHNFVVDSVRKHEKWDFASSAAVVICALVLVVVPEATWLDTVVSLGLGPFIFWRGAAVCLAAFKRTRA